jgi:Protein of unknown function (DUF3551)
MISCSSRVKETMPPYLAFDTRRRRRELLVKLIFAIFALAVTLPVGSASAQMYDPNYPVCMHLFGDLEGDRMDCIFSSLAQCSAAASGRPATCLVNPYFARRPSRPGH